MENLTFCLIIVVLCVAIYLIHSTFSVQQNVKSEGENFDVLSDSNNVKTCSSNGDLLTLNPYQRCNVLGAKKFMVRDLRTKLWLISGQEEGFNKFLPGRFGVPLLMSENPSDYLPLRTISNPNDYLLATFTGNGIRTVSNPYNQSFVIQVFIYQGFNVLGYTDENLQTKYLSVDDNGNISTVLEPESASVIEIIEI